MTGGPERLLEPAIELVSKSVSLLAKVQKLSTSKNFGKNSKIGNDLAVTTADLSALLRQISEVVGTPDPKAKPTQDSSISTEKEERANTCMNCGSPIPSARLAALPDTKICITCADQLDTRHPDPFSVVSETDAGRYKAKHQKDVEEEQLRAKSRRAPRASSQPRKKHRRKRRRKKQK